MVTGKTLPNGCDNGWGTGNATLTLQPPSTSPTANRLGSSIADVTVSAASVYAPPLVKWGLRWSVWLDEEKSYLFMRYGVDASVDLVTFHHAKWVYQPRFKSGSCSAHGLAMLLNHWGVLRGSAEQQVRLLRLCIFSLDELVSFQYGAHPALADFLTGDADSLSPGWLTGIVAPFARDKQCVEAQHIADLDDGDGDDDSSGDRKRQ